MIDYYMVSRDLPAMPAGCGADFDSAWSPHYGIELRIRAKPKDVINYVTKEPSLPKNIVNFEKELHNENPLQDKTAPACKIAKTELREAKLWTCISGKSGPKKFGTNYFLVHQHPS